MIRFRHQSIDILTEKLIIVIPEILEGAGVDVTDDTAGIDQDDPVDYRFKY